MTSKIAGTNLKKNIRNKTWLMKLGLSLVLSNIFFFILFSRSETKKAESSIPEGWVEIQVRAELLTPFHSGKKVLLLQRNAGKQVEAMLENSPVEPDGRFTVLVKEAQAEVLLKYESWEIVPFLKTLSLNSTPRGEMHEIRY